jgi:hypothetical protein
MDNGDELKAKAREMAEMLFAHHRADKEMVIQHCLPSVEELIRKFYVEHGQWPVFRRDPGGHGRSIVMGLRDEMESD